MFLNISLHLHRDQVFHRLLFFNQLPNLCGRDIQKGYLFKIEGLTRGMDPSTEFLIIAEGRNQGLRDWRRKRGLLRSRSSHDNKVAKREEVLKILPGLNLHKSIPSQDKEEGILIPFKKIPNSVDGIRFSRPLQLNVGSGEIGVCQGGQSHHLQSVMRLDDFLIYFMRRDSCRDEDHFLKVKSLPNLLCSPEVTQMDGIECPSEKPDSLFSSLFFNC